MDFLQLDVGSNWVAGNLVSHFIRAGNLAQARQASEKLGGDPRSRMITACLKHVPPGDVDKIARDLEPEILANPDAENRYLVASTFAFCGKNDIALRVLKGAIAGHYCAYPAMQNDPMLAQLRGTPEFTQLLSAAKQCQSDFLSQRSQASR
jgi:hypothetical protein